MNNYVDAFDTPARNTGTIKLHRPEDFDGMRTVGRLAAQALDMLVAEVKPGIATDHIDRLAFEFAMDHGVTPAPLNYRGFTKSVCTSVNHVVCHGIPGDRVLRDGDIVNVDVTLIKDGWHGDTNRMYFVGDVPRKAERLCAVTYEAMMRGIAAIKPGATLGDIGAAIQTYAEGERCSVVREFCGHGLGRVFHDVPNVLHFGKPHVKMLNDGWTAVTRDRSLSAQFEHSIGVTADGVEIFTKSPAGLDHPPYG